MPRQPRRVSCLYFVACVSGYFTEVLCILYIISVLNPTWKWWVYSKSTVHSYMSSAEIWNLMLLNTIDLNISVLLAVFRW